MLKEEIISRITEVRFVAENETTLAVKKDSAVFYYGKKKNEKSSPSEVSWDLPQRGEGNLISDSWVKQGIDWASWSNTTLRHLC